MVLTGDAIAHRSFTDFPGLLDSGDLLVVNETRVVRARLRGRRSPGGGVVELLLLGPAGGAAFDPAASRWKALVKPGRRLPAGSEIELPGGARARIEAVEPDGVRIVTIVAAVSVGALLEMHGEVPLPPYIGAAGLPHAERYQTVFARVPGSVAAPTASLHFTPGSFEALERRGVSVARLVLDVGIGTFRPMSSERIEDHRMHAESYAIPPEAVAAIERTHAAGGRVVAAGTTVLRALEAAAQADGSVRAGASTTDLYIMPGFGFRVVDALLTNFHLPRSTLLVLVAAFAGYDRVMAAYQAAIAEHYRFFSFGDAMFVVRNPDHGCSRLLDRGATQGSRGDP